MSRRLAILAAVALASCTATRPGPSKPAEPARDDFGLPAVRAPLEFPAGASEVTLGWLVDELARLSGQELTLAPNVRQQLDVIHEQLELSAAVPADEVYAYVEALLGTYGVVIAPVKGGTRPVLGLYGRARDQGEPRAVPVDPERCAEFARHPALLCQVVLSFENIDSRQLQTQLRQLLVDDSGYLQCVPAGERSLLIQAPGAKLLGLVQLLREVDRASAARPRVAGAESSPNPEAVRSQARFFPRLPDGSLTH